MKLIFTSPKLRQHVVECVIALDSVSLIEPQFKPVPALKITLTVLLSVNDKNYKIENSGNSLRQNSAKVNKPVYGFANTPPKLN